jgi:hypothetical protein
MERRRPDRVIADSLARENKKKFPGPAGNPKIAYESPGTPYGEIENVKLRQQLTLNAPLRRSAVV